MSMKGVNAKRKGKHKILDHHRPLLDLSPVSLGLPVYSGNITYIPNNGLIEAGGADERHRLYRQNDTQTNVEKNVRQTNKWRESRERRIEYDGKR